jgi:division protein CdvB (Snf7/Vps24/ESCRT-III family)
MTDEKIQELIKALEKQNEILEYRNELLEEKIAKAEENHGNVEKYLEEIAANIGGILDEISQ